MVIIDMYSYKPFSKTYYSVMRISSVVVSNTSFNCTSLGWDRAFSNITTSRNISSRHVFPLRRFFIYFAATSSLVSLWINFFTTANLPLETINGNIVILTVTFCLKSELTYQTCTVQLKRLVQENYMCTIQLRRLVQENYMCTIQLKRLVQENYMCTIQLRRLVQENSTVQLRWFVHYSSGHCFFTSQLWTYFQFTVSYIKVFVIRWKCIIEKYNKNIFLIWSVTMSIIEQ